MRVVFITPASTLRRSPVYRWGSSLYGTRDAITGPLILAGIVRRAGHEVEVYEELRGTVDYERLYGWADVACLYTMTSNAPRAYDIADRFHAQGHARVLIGGLHASALPEEALAHADQVLVGEGSIRFSTSSRAAAPSPSSNARPCSTSMRFPGRTTRCSRPPATRPTS
ncbi:hypothetical protein J2S71_001950 [Olsenella profusa DSM 13989]|uniref:cobalamin-dependent protein n=1 Tax=Olsenella profusa TaxID=138595 RepID=UPI0027870271|nr:cobalamin-dependent protein [Olsenella profusa]MDP9860254.1 hypothetical protein [Olsenella profusa DSM 13989]